MKISVASARNLAQALESAADAAYAKGDESFDLGDALLAQDDAELSQLKDAVQAMPGG